VAIDLNEQLNGSLAFAHQADMRRLAIVGEDGLHVMNAIERMVVLEHAGQTDDAALAGAFRTAIHVPEKDK
jgi:hypothetical protein